MDFSFSPKVEQPTWWSSGTMSPRCKVAIVMGVTDPGGERHRRQSLVLVPLDGCP